MVQVAVDIVGYTDSLPNFVNMIQQLDRNGVDIINLSDDLWFYDIFALLGYVGKITDRTRFSIITNPYSRHPALVARAIATIKAITGRRVRICYAAGGSYTLRPLGIPMWDRPVTHVREAIQICRQLLTEEMVNYQGEVFSLDQVQLKFPFTHEPPEFFIAGRGTRIMTLVGELADGAFIDPISPVYEQMIMQLIRDTARKRKRDPEKIIFHAPIEYLEKTQAEFLKFAALRIANTLQDIPISLIETYETDASPSAMMRLRQIHDAPNSEVAATLVTPEVAKLFHGMVNSVDDLVDSIKQKAKQGFKSIGVVVPNGEEQNAVEALTPDIIDEIHNIDN
jgi:alkanesulfonate monooxygenase SsuD/methylene tetrahydromethanopterin reductase-like flavin-dependent oxidoreductase (luciferase family)